MPFPFGQGPRPKTGVHELCTVSPVSRIRFGSARWDSDSVRFPPLGFGFGSVYRFVIRNRSGIGSDRNVQPNSKLAPG